MKPRLVVFLTLLFLISTGCALRPPAYKIRICEKSKSYRKGNLLTIERIYYADTLPGGPRYKWGWPNPPSKHPGKREKAAHFFGESFPFGWISDPALQDSLNYYRYYRKRIKFSRVRLEIQNAVNVPCEPIP